MIDTSGSDPVLKLIGLTLTSVDVSTDLVRLLFEDGWRLIIYNPCAMEVSGLSVPLGDGNMLIGRTVITSVTTCDGFELQLSGGVSLRVDLRDEAFVGPEAMQLIGPTGEIIVWN
jgi:hypothetical protein